MKPVVRTARRTDVDPIHDLLLPYAEEGIILKRTHAEIERDVHTFYVAEYRGAVVGCVAFHRYGHHLIEIRSLAVEPSAKKIGLGRALVEAVMTDLAVKEPAAKIFTLTYIPAFFIKMGFHEVDKDTLPEKIWKDCMKCAKQDTCDETALVYGRSE